jgi:UDP-2,3-diacylglucosamine hydrolase
VWSKNSRLSHKEEYRFKGEGEPLYQFAQSYLKEHKVDYFIFGHFHSAADVSLPEGSRLLLLKDWISSSPYICFDGEQLITDSNK